jgi:hydroxymethylbilane synthase
MELPAELVVSVITKRESPLDALISKNGERLVNLPQGATIGTSSLRRSSQLLKYRVDFKIHPLRGNVDTRLRKLKTGNYDAIILASAGLNRLGWTSHITEEISEEILLPAMGQGALGIETRLDDTKTYDLISTLNHDQTNYAVTAERALVGRLDGGCQVPIGAYARIEKGLITLKGLVASLDGEVIYKLENVGPVDDAINIGQELGSRLLKMGANEILEKLI